MAEGGIEDDDIYVAPTEIDPDLVVDISVNYPEMFSQLLDPSNQTEDKQGEIARLWTQMEIENHGELIPHLKLLSGETMLRPNGATILNFDDESSRS